MTEDPIGTREAGRIAKRHQRTIVDWIRKGQLPADKMPGKRGPYLIKRADLHQLIKDLYTPHPYQPEQDQGQ